VLAIVGLIATLLLWAAWAVFITIKMTPFDWSDGGWLIALGILVLIAWVPVVTAICLRRLIGSGDMGPVGVVGLVLLLYGAPATFIGCPLVFPGIVLVGASIWHRTTVARSG
jgi:hypothetical protein